MNILVTGCAGFIGSHFVEEALSRGDSVYGVDILTYAGRIENMSSFLSDIAWYQLDICDTPAIERIVRTNFNLTMKGYLLSESDNAKKPTTNKFITPQRVEFFESVEEEL